nr:hypothetical protein GCM10020185_69070 [Pseudomonas brassicacearum subsp. brassicacearum]
MTIGLVLALQTVDRTFDALLDGEMQHYNQEAVRGQAWSLVEQLRGLDDSARERQLETVRPHYGLDLALVERDQLSLSTQEKAELSQGLLVMRDQYTQFISRIDDGSQLLSIKLPAEPSLMPFYITVAYMMIAIMIGFVLFFSGCDLTGATWRSCAWRPSALVATICRCVFSCPSVRTFATWPNISI